MQFAADDQREKDGGRESGAAPQASMSLHLRSLPALAANGVYLLRLSPLFASQRVAELR